MTIGICGCVTGPPPGGICGACGAWGVGYRPPYGPPDPLPSFTPGPVQFVPLPLTGDDVRRIVREEIEAALTKALGAPTAVSEDQLSVTHETVP